MTKKEFKTYLLGFLVLCLILVLSSQYKPNQPSVPRIFQNGTTAKAQKTKPLPLNEETTEPLAVSGIVTTANDHAPVSGAIVQLEWSTQTENPNSEDWALVFQGQSDENGQFRWNLPKTGQLRCLAWSENGISCINLGEAPVYEIEPGENLFEVILMDTEPFHLRAVDSQGQPVESFNLSCQLELPAWPEFKKESENQDGLALCLFHHPYRMEITSPGYLSQKIKLSPEPGGTYTFKLRPAGRVEVEVKDQDGRPLEGARVACNPKRTQTDSNGVAFLDDLTLNSHLLLNVWKRGFIRQSTTFSLKNQQIQKLEFVLEKLEANDRVFHAQVVDTSGHPIPMVQIQADEESTFTDESGEFAVTLKDYDTPSLTIAQISLDKIGYRKRAIQIHEQDLQAEKTIVLIKPSWAKGQVVDSDGKPIIGAALKNQLTHAVYTTRPNGTFNALNTAESDNYTVMKEDYHTQLVRLKPKSDDNIIVLNPKEKTIAIVTFGEPQKPAVGFRYQFIPKNISYESHVLGPWTWVENQNGQFSFTYSSGDLLLVDFKDYPLIIVQLDHLEEDPNQTLYVHFKEKGLHYEGFVIDSDGNPLEGVLVQCSTHYRPDPANAYRSLQIPNFLPDTDRVKYQALSGPDGHFSVTGFESERQQELEFSREDYSPAKKVDVELLNEEQRLQILQTLEKGGRIHGQVSRKAFPKAAMVSLKGPQTQSFCRLNEDGLAGYEKRQLEEGTWKIRLLGSPTTGANMLAEKEVKLETGEDVQVDFLEKEYPDLTGNVIVNGLPAEAWSVVLIPEGKDLYFSGYSTPKARTQGDGFFEIQNIIPGTYTLLILTPDEPEFSVFLSTTPYFSQIEIQAEMEHQVLDLLSGSIRGVLMGTKGKRQRLTLASDVFWGPYKAKHQEILADGSFQFTGLVPGHYSLFLENPTLRILKQDIVITPDKLDIDLGPIDPELGASLWIKGNLPDNPETANIKGWLFVSIKPLASTEYLTDSLDSLPTRLDHLPTGPCQIRLICSQAYRPVPNIFEIELEDGRESEILIDLVPRTGISILNQNYPNNEIMGGVLHFPGDVHQVIPYEPVTLNFEPSQFETSTLSSVGGTLWDLPPGPITIELQMSDESIRKRLFELIPGKMEHWIFQ